MTAVALTDHGTTYGLIEFYKACKKAEIKPILGVEAYVARRGHTDKEPGVDTKPYHLVLLAKNKEGYENILRLTSIAHLDGFYYKPRVDKELLKKYSKGIIGLSACLNGEISRAALSDNMETAERALSEYKEIFGEGNFYLELQPQTATKNNDQSLANARLIELAKKTNTPLVATKDVHYINFDDKEAQDALLCIQTGTTLDNPDRLSMMDIDCSFSTEGDMRAWFSDTPEAIDNTVKIAEACDVELTLGVNILPKFKTPNGKSDVDYLRELCEDGIKRRYKEITPEVRERLEWELDTINKMGFASYFLIVADFVKYAKGEGIVVGPGRGSAAGSIVSYVLGVTDLDPIHYKLLFERFLNPDRISMPDIDMDFADIKRHKVIEYVMEKYGRDKVAGIITFGTMMARAAVRDVGRVMGLPYGEVDRIAKMIPTPVQGRHTPLSSHVEEVKELRDLYNDNPDIKRLLDLSIKMEGTVRHASQHACAVVIADKPLMEYTAIQKAQGGDVESVTQYSMKPIEDVGLLKMDFLGLANLSIIQDTIEIVEAVSKTETGEATKIDIEKIPLDDKKTFNILSRAETTGVFQLESSGMKRYIKDLQPTDIEDIIAMVALYRPGPMQFIESFINRKHGREKIEYMHPSMENALKNTYGIPVYQEQVMQISKDMAGFTGGEADTLRKAMGKKIAELMAKMRAKFIAGATTQGISKQLATEVFQTLEDFAAYGFNRSHAACYAMIAYRTAYLKANWPNCFMAALMNSDYGNLDRITIEVEECKLLGLEVLPPDINDSYSKFSVVPKTNKIRFGLLAIKNVGSDIADAIIKERKENGKFESLEDFLERVNHKNLNKKVLDALVKCGAMDALGARAEMLHNMQKMLDFNREVRASSEQPVGLFGKNILSKPTLQMEPAEPIEKKEILAWEKELLGLYISAHPFLDIKPLIADLIKSVDELKEMKDGNWVNVAGVITKIHSIRTKKNEPMCFVTIEDGMSSFEIIVFPSILESTRTIWQEDNIVIVGGRLSFKDGEIKVLANKVEVVSVDNMEKIKTQFADGKSEKPQVSNFKPQQNFKTKNNTPAPNFKQESEGAGFRGNDNSDIKQFFNGNIALKDDGLYISLPKKMKKAQVEHMKSLLQKHPGTTQVFFALPDKPAIKTSFKIDSERFI